MKKAILVFLILPLLLLGACSEKGWSYKYEGATDNWNGVTEIFYDKENGARFVGKIKYLGNGDVKKLQFISELTQTSQQTGRVQTPNFKEGYIIIFQDVPNTDSTKNDFKNGVTDEEVKSFFGDYPVFKIDWTDEEGIDHTETIYLKYVAQ
ncbi:hypothetical protein BBR47_56060 [Brevibacillus brevis NBRC 100599]|uniref:Lipoprotein n=1 Tax=Brevibacillus brevis (strain 47 / JCM 6285 / NBRC 100599) TaxID=358681 RepID=C0Z8F6_BREBN|nr:hypothetical protein [Brevibacillus brevis]BAH46583.1 hypothetical protein BBR47_56060 [Brevibacillus brevis NBRC 100599]